VVSGKLASLLHGQWAVGQFCYVVSGQLASFVTWSVGSWPVLLLGQWQVGQFCYVACKNMDFVLLGQWQVGLFCYVISNKLACFFMWSVIS